MQIEMFWRVWRMDASHGYTGLKQLHDYIRRMWGEEIETRDVQTDRMRIGDTDCQSTGRQLAGRLVGTW